MWHSLLLCASGAGWLVMADVMGRHRAEQVWAVVEAGASVLGRGSGGLEWAGGQGGFT